MFKLATTYLPTGDQPQAIAALVANIKAKKRHQVLLGATGTGKTFTVANVIAAVQKPTLVLAHNKTLALQLYTELKQIFPHNRVEYFVSYFDFYQPEAYIPRTDTYIDKSVKNNYEIEMMRLSALNALSTRSDVIVVATVAAIYGENDPNEYQKAFLELTVGQSITRKTLIQKLVERNYQRNDLDLPPGSFSVKGDVLKLAPGWTSNFYIRIDLFGDEIADIAIIDPLTGVAKNRYHQYTIFPAEDYVTNHDRLQISIQRIEAELKTRLAYFKANNLPLEAERLGQRTNYDLESLREFGTCSGIENYSRHLELRAEGEPPYTLIDYFPADFLTVIDESHMTLPQIRGMYNTDCSRKLSLVKYGFRLPSALDNRPLNFDEFMQKMKQTIYVSATPGDFELNLTHHKVVEQIIRPTGLLDPVVTVRPATNQIDDILAEIRKAVSHQTRILITTLTIRMAEELSAYLQSHDVKAAYLHNELKTLERTKILNDLRRGVYDVVVGINLLREGLDLPEVALICILDADKQGFLRNARSLIQTIGRAARNAHGRVILYADEVSPAMEQAMVETQRRRTVQMKYNQEHHIVPQTIVKPISDVISTTEASHALSKWQQTKNKKAKAKAKTQLLADLRDQMLKAAKALDYEQAAHLRDLIIEITASD